MKVLIFKTLIILPISTLTHQSFSSTIREQILQEKKLSKDRVYEYLHFDYLIH